MSNRFRMAESTDSNVICHDRRVTFAPNLLSGKWLAWDKTIDAYPAP